MYINFTIIVEKDKKRKIYYKRKGENKIAKIIDEICTSKSNSREGGEYQIPGYMNFHPYYNYVSCRGRKDEGGEHQIHKLT